MVCSSTVITPIQRQIDYWLPSRCIQIAAQINFGSGLQAHWLKRRELAALKVIEEWLDKCDRRVYHTISGGKDSLVVGDLIRRLHPDCPMVWINQGPLAEWADCLLLLQHLKAQGWNIVEICPSLSLWQLYKDYGIPLEGHMQTRLDKIINQALMYDPLAEYESMTSPKGYAWGLRHDESKGRRKFMQSRNTLYQRMDKRWICSPVGFWHTTEIWQYIDHHQLPYPAMYDRDRMTIRNGPPIGTTGVNRGRLSELRRYHPDLWAEFVHGFPELQNYA